MPLTLPTYEEVRDALIADIKSRLIARYAGQILPLNFDVGSTNLTIAEVIAFACDMIIGRIDTLDRSLRIGTATGTDLDDMGALVNAIRDPGSYSQVPVLFIRPTADASVINIPTGFRVQARASSTSPSLTYLTQQSVTLGTGIAGQIASGAVAGWVWCKADTPGTIYNIAAGRINYLVDQIAGVTAVTNVALLDPPLAPTASVVGGTGTSYTFRVVARGVYGTTLPSPALIVSANSVLNGSNHVDLSWVPVANAASYDVILQTGSTWMLYGNTTSTTFSAAGVFVSASYVYPTLNNANSGSGGINPQGDDDFRNVIKTSLAVRSKATNSAIVNALLDVSGVAKAKVYDSSNSNYLSGAVGIIEVDWEGFTYPAGATVTANVAAAIASTKAAGVYAYTYEVAPVTVTIAYTAVSSSTVTNKSSLVVPIDAALTTYFSGLDFDQDVSYLQVIQAIMSVPGVTDVTSLVLNANATNYTFANVPAHPGGTRSTPSLLVKGTVTPTVV